MLSKKEVQHVLEGCDSLMVGFGLAEKPGLRQGLEFSRSINECVGSPYAQPAASHPSGRTLCCLSDP